MTLYYSDPNVPKHFGSYWTPSQWQWGLTEQDVQTHGTGQPLTVARGSNGLRVVNAGNNNIYASNHFGSYYTPQNNAWTPSPGSVTNVMRQNSYANSSNARINGLHDLAAKNANLNTGNSDPSFWGNILDGFGNLAKTNPMAFITTPIDIWSAFANYRANKQALNMYQDQLNLQREAYEKNEARNQRRFDMLEQARATSQL